MDENTVVNDYVYDTGSYLAVRFEDENSPSWICLLNFTTVSDTGVVTLFTVYWEEGKKVYITASIAWLSSMVLRRKEIRGLGKYRLTVPFLVSTVSLYRNLYLLRFIRYVEPSAVGGYMLMNEMIVLHRRDTSG